MEIGMRELRSLVGFSASVCAKLDAIVAHEELGHSLTVQLPKHVTILTL